MSKFRLVPDSLIVAPTNPQFNDNEDAIINVKCSVERDSLVGQWATRFTIYQGSTVIMDTRSWHTDVNPWGGVDRQYDNYDLNLGKLMPGEYSMTVVISAHDLGQ